MMMDLLPKDEAQYRPAEGLDESCGKCASYTAPSTCAIVEGPVDPSFTCDKFTSEESGEIAEPVAAELSEV